MSMRLYDYAPSPNERVPVDIFGGDTLRPD